MRRRRSHLLLLPASKRSNHALLVAESGLVSCHPILELFWGSARLAREEQLENEGGNLKQREEKKQLTQPLRHIYPRPRAQSRLHLDGVHAVLRIPTGVSLAQQHGSLIDRALQKTLQSSRSRGTRARLLCLGGETYLEHCSQLANLSS